MATYVTSDAHGHLRALDRVLEMAQPGAQDTLYVLGDMVDRGPDPAGVLQLVHDLPNARALMGNHERMMLDVLGSGDEVDILTWHMNGGYTTAQTLDALPRERYRELMDWIACLPLFEVVEAENLLPSARAGERRAYLLCHAGIDALALRGYLATAGIVADARGGYGHVGADELRAAMGEQSADDLLWIRAPFWSGPTGLVGADGCGPVVISGHTPSILLGRYASLMSGTGVDAQTRGVMVEVGASHATGGAPDRIDIDCAAAAGHPNGRVGIMRLEDRRVWLADVEDGE